jgi:hypothetical protein
MIKTQITKTLSRRGITAFLFSFMLVAPAAYVHRWAKEDI